MSNKTRFKALKIKLPATKPKVIDSWEKLLDWDYGYARVTKEQHIQLEPYRLKFEAGTFSIKNAGSDFRAIMNILYS